MKTQSSREPFAKSSRGECYSAKYYALLTSLIQQEQRVRDSSSPFSKVSQHEYKRDSFGWHAMVLTSLECLVGCRHYRLETMHNHVANKQSNQSRVWRGLAYHSFSSSPSTVSDLKCKWLQQSSQNRWQSRSSLTTWCFGYLKCCMLRRALMSKPPVHKTTWPQRIHEMQLSPKHVSRLLPELEMPKVLKQARPAAGGVHATSWSSNGLARNTLRKPRLPESTKTETVFFFLKLI